ncbi:hypothetical protein [Chondromyces apiculatus]|uniref:Uncharacterized protein n=1 Tax=Chondromyces apiculatus DSM 436 TaxID=1192034 RepID=A0A017SX49_9BACT|nr:hypothetical protein [Chondromyces apiculatus]EYF01518.1 Hypothetical protein CAP_8079 [Chondromyces apiculatus DSM 436]
MTSRAAFPPSFFLPTALFALLGVTGCGGPPTPSPIEGEPVCVDYDMGAAKTRMRGSLRHPVQVTVTDGGDLVGKTILDGRRQDSAPPSMVLVPDANDEVEVTWAQCENEPAPQAAVKAGDPKGEAPSFECGNATVYKTEKLTIRRGDASSRKLTFPPPPKTDCWTDPGLTAGSAAPAAAPPVVPPAAGADTAAAANAGTDAATPTAGADAGAGDAGAGDAGAGDAGADAATPATDAGSPTDAGTGADASAKKKAPRKPETSPGPAPPKPSEAYE